MVLIKLVSCLSTLLYDQVLFIKFSEPIEEDDLESSGFGMSVGVSGRGRGMRSGGPGRRVMKLGVGGFFVKVFLTGFHPFFFSVYFSTYVNIV